MNLASGCTDVEVTQTTGPPIRGRTEGAPEGDARREDTAELQPISPIFGCLLERTPARTLHRGDRGLGAPDGKLLLAANYPGRMNRARAAYTSPSYNGEDLLD